MNRHRSSIQLALDISRSSAEPLQKQIIRQLREMITKGSLRLGEQLPSIRELARQSGISINTIKIAYEQLHAEGYVVTSAGKGSFVAEFLPDENLWHEQAPSSPDNPNRHARHFPPLFSGRSQKVAGAHSIHPTIDFRLGRPNQNSFPFKEWRELANVNLKYAQFNMTEYGDPAGLLGLRTAISDHLAQARGFRPDPEQVIITSGIQEALNLTARLFVAPGTLVATECPCYKGARYVFESYGARIISAEVDQQGIRVEQLPIQRTALLYVTPSHQYPLGSILSVERRKQILQWAAQSGAYILEDDYDGDFRFDSSPLPALTTMDENGCVIYMGTFSKSMGAGLRLGYLVVPHELVEQTVIAKELFDNGNPWLVQKTMEDFIVSGKYARHIREIRKNYLALRDHLCQVLNRHFGPVELTGLEGGMHLCWRLPDGLPDASEIQHQAYAVDLGVYSLDGGAAAVDNCFGIDQRMLLLGYSSLTEEQITEGIQRLARLLNP